ncbi:RsmB/NOP family class I SAM-dependent RNA methyltransferase [Rhizosphaericola mali]|uniref:Fmu (Sun) domain protein n=1 Tax=Rhizosphaericola mali TaxID=2545455 RepID=A0A5P2G8F6_9BACT|nr:Fmu (Sun) domain protein [Rhizosphaericola mali]QES90579.1 Fmu (Sun) domain protein [Rhizosphaericola mali]
MYPNRFNSYSNSAQHFIDKYDGSLPFAHFIKAQFAENKKYGSKDRRWIAHFCYCYFRVASALLGSEKEIAIRIAVYLCSDDLSEYDAIFDKHWFDASNLNERIEIIQNQFPAFNWVHSFPFLDKLSDKIDKETFQISFLQQPDVFLRVRPQKLEIVKKKLKKVDWNYHWENEYCLRIPPNIKIEEYFEINKEVVVQDYMSQSIAQYFPDIPVKSYFDCCAASGGKAMLFHDYFPDVFLNVTDIRSSILNNLKKRFHEAGITFYTANVMDMATPISKDPKRKFEFVLCDAPCSGSGTWARSPENLSYYTPSDIEEKHALQVKIADNAIRYVQNGGYLLYITCSVFTQENESVVSEILKRNNHVVLEKTGYLFGAGKRADTMFATLFKVTN